MSGAIHIKSVEVQACALIAELVVDIDYNSVSYSSCDVGERPLTINPNGRTVENAVRVGHHPGYVEVVGNSGSLGRKAEKKKKSSSSVERIR